MDHLAASRAKKPRLRFMHGTRSATIFSVCLVLALYVYSFQLPVIQVEQKLYLGWDVFWGCFDCVMRRGEPGCLFYWLPNPLLWVALLSLWMERYRLAAFFSGFALLIAMLIFCGEGWGLLSGEYVWLGSIALLNLAVGCLWLTAWRKRSAS
jgi:hypothetical protein